MHSFAATELNLLSLETLYVLMLQRPQSSGRTAWITARVSRWLRA